MNFYVWETKSISETECEAIIIAPEQWITLASECESTLTDYEIEGISGWRVFTSDEAKRFRDQYKSNISRLNEYLAANGQDTFSDGEEDRYLCNNCLSSFSVNGGLVSQAGTKKEYYLRPVKTVRFKLK